jgi:hypothetical protein
LVEPKAILAAVEGILAEDWSAILKRTSLPALLINATDPYGPPGSAPFLSRAQALETVGALARGSYLAISGNHLTMIFGQHAIQTAAAIRAFVTADVPDERREDEPENE